MLYNFELDHEAVNSKNIDRQDQKRESFHVDQAPSRITPILQPYRVLPSGDCDGCARARDYDRRRDADVFECGGRRGDEDLQGELTDHIELRGIGQAKIQRHRLYRPYRGRSK
jgi:hypothetical protein